MRDDFSAATKRTLASRVGTTCSNPTCGRPTSGPADLPDGTVNIGVAAHITAAAPLGPRYDASITPETRKSVANGIWLCATCATLIDSDVIRFPVRILESWKTQSEQRIRAQVEGQVIQIFGIQHAAVPILSDMNYEEARQQLLSRGWQLPTNSTLEILNVSSTETNSIVTDEPPSDVQGNTSAEQMSFCSINFCDMYGNTLHVVADFENQSGSPGSIRSWWIGNSESQDLQDTQDDIVQVCAPPNLFSLITPRTPQDRVREVLGVPHRLSEDDAWCYRFHDALIQIAFDDNNIVQYVALALTIHATNSGFSVPVLGERLGTITFANMTEEAGDVEHRETLRTQEILWRGRVGPAGAWSYCTLGALWPLLPGCLREPNFIWDQANDVLASDPNELKFNWIAISSRSEDIWFDWSLAH